MSDKFQDAGCERRRVLGLESINLKVLNKREIAGG